MVARPCQDCLCGGEGGPRTAVWIREVAKIYYVVKKEEEEKEEE